MKNALQIFGIATAFVVALGAGILGCGEGDDEDMTGDGGAGGSSGTLFALKSGDYVVESATDVNDGCKINVDKPVAMMGVLGATIPLTMQTTTLPDGGVVNTGVVMLGTMQGTPPQYSLGQGNISSNEGTLVSPETMISAPSPSMCTYRRATTATLKMTDHYKFTLKATRTQSMGNMCDFTNCTSTWTWTMRCPTCASGSGGSADARP